MPIMTSKKYLVLPGHVHSRTDGDRHFIDAGRLMALYCVSPAECVIANTREHLTLRSEGHDVSTLIPLTPRYDGRYPIFEKQEAVETVRDH